MQARRCLIVCSLAVLTVLLTAAAPLSAASTPPPISLSLAGLVQNACTGLPVATASETLVPLSGQVPPSPIRLGGLFAYPSLAPGAYALGVSAPGYQPIATDGTSVDGTTGAILHTGIPIAGPTPPPILPAGATVREALATDIHLTPVDPCGPQGPPILPALTGTIRDATTGRLLTNATINLIPLNNQTPSPPPIRLAGIFTIPTLQPGNWALQIAAPGHTPIGTGNQPGIPITGPNPPPTLPTGASAATTLALDIQLPTN